MNAPKLPEGWTRQERGWYTGPEGGVCQERNGWYFYPADNEVQHFGPWHTLRDAISALLWWASAPHPGRTA